MFTRVVTKQRDVVWLRTGDVTGVLGRHEIIEAALDKADIRRDIRVTPMKGRLI